jgi:hypothetical protein
MNATGHFVLLGDSILENARYVPGQPDVVATLRGLLPLGWQATLLARDGAIVRDVIRQLAIVPRDATHLVLSVGGNDALGYRSASHGGATSLTEALAKLAVVQADFAREYRSVLHRVSETKLRFTVCTIYDAIPGLDPVERVGLSLFNDVIVREAAHHRINVIDLRLVCADVGDYSSESPIEPSYEGGLKIARAIARAVTSVANRADGCTIF